MQVGDLANRDFYALNIFYSIGSLNCVTVGNSNWKPYSICHDSYASYFHHRISILGKYLLLVTAKQTEIRLTARLGKSVPIGWSHFDSPYGEAYFSGHRLQFTQYCNIIKNTKLVHFSELTLPSSARTLIVVV